MKNITISQHLYSLTTNVLPNYFIYTRVFIIPSKLVQYFCSNHILFFYLFGILRCFQHCTGHITTVSWKGRGNQYIQFVRVLYCKLPTNGKQLPAFPLEAVPGTEPRTQRWEARVLPLCHRGPYNHILRQTDK